MLRLHHLTRSNRGGDSGQVRAHHQSVYGRSYLERAEAVSIDPIELKLAKRTYETTALKGVFGALRDSGPDYWGRRIIEKHVGKAQLGELEYLLQSPDDRAGALGFGLNQSPPAPRREFNKTLTLDKLQALADAIVADEELHEGAGADQVQDLMLIGTSMGGARPKVIVEDEEGLWIAKFNTAQDRWNSARVERAMLVLARNCGLQSSESKVVTVAGRDVLLVKRFDREKTKYGYLRSRMISGLTLLKAEETPHDRDRWSYVFLAEELRRVCAQPKRDARELFQRMCFNALISNTDDHPRNHAIIARESDWKLSPAYDLTPSTPVSIERRDLALTCGDMGRYAHAENLLSQSARFLLERDEAEAIISEMEDRVVSTWYEVARSEGVSEQDCGFIERAFVYDGFRFDIAV
jgi:serine/threonine-protein kinase HipA